MNLPTSQSCENNKNPILNALKNYVIPKKTMLELGSYTGQHAEFLAKNLNIDWQTSDTQENIWILEQKYQQPNSLITNKPLVVKIGESELNEQVLKTYQYIYTANTLHIMSQENVSKFCQTITHLLEPQGLLFIYGPFKFEGNFTSESNKNFNSWLKNRDKLSGIRDFEFIEQTLKQTGIFLLETLNLPANNQLLVFKKP